MAFNADLDENYRNLYFCGFFIAKLLCKDLPMSAVINFDSMFK